MTNQKEKRKVPELRFPEFSGEWEEKKLSEITKINQGLQIPIADRKLEYKEGYHFYITNEFLKSNSKYKYYIENPPVNVIANKEDILMTRTGNTGKVITDVEGAFHNNFFKIKYDIKSISKLFLYEILRSPKINNKFLRLAGASTIPDLNHKDFYRVKINIPKINEQQKIGEFFSKLDRQIELEEKKLALLEEQKKGYMQKIFSQELRFKDEDGEEYPEWKIIKLSDLYNIGKAGGTPKSNESRYYNGKINFLSVKDITTQGMYIQYTEKKITEAGLENSSAWIVPVNSICYSMYASVGFLSINKIPLATSQAIFSMNFKDNELTKYIYYYLLYFQTLGEIEKLVGTGTQSNLSSKIMGNMEILVPIKDEYLKINSLLDKYYNKIKVLKYKIELLKKMRASLYNKVFI